MKQNNRNLKAAETLIGIAFVSILASGVTNESTCKHVPLMNLLPCETLDSLGDHFHPAALANNMFTAIKHIEYTP